MQALKELCYSPYFGVVLSIFMYQIGVFVSHKLKTPVANPLLIAVILIIAFLKIFRIPMEAFQTGGELITLFWRRPRLLWRCQSIKTCRF